jgi:PAS domain S-box-containing protein
MLISSHLQGVADYFRKSGQLYYMLIDLQGRFISVNPLFQQRFGPVATDFYGGLAADIFAPTDRNKYRFIVQECIQNPGTVIPAELQIRSSDDSFQTISWEFSACFNGVGELESIQAAGIAIDEVKITELRKAEQQLQKSELFYRNLFANSLDGVLITDERGIITFASASIKQILGYSIEDLLGKSTFMFAHPDDHALAYSAFMDEVTQQPQKKFLSIRLLNKAGEWIWSNVRGHNLMQNPYIKGMVVYFYDDTLRKEAEDALSESEKRFRNLIYNLSQGVVLLNEKAEVVVFNRAAQVILGTTEDQVFGTALFDPQWNIIHEDGQDFPERAHPVQVAIQTKKPVRDIVMGVYRPGGNNRVWLLVNADPVLGKEGNIFNVICSFTDITEQKRLSHELIEQEIQKQRQLTQATIDGQEKERLEIGKELHDNISQHLTTTRLYLEVGKEKASEEVLEMIILAHKNLSEIIHQIRLLSQSLVPPTLGDLGMIESVQDLCDSLKRTHTFQIEFHHRHFSEDKLPDNLKLMLFRIIQEQVNNIIRHAEASNIQIRLQSDAENIVLIIADNGKGFDLSHYKKGLGLTNIANRTNLFNGKVEIDAAPGEGCSISVAIPLPFPVNPLLSDELVA